MRSRMFFLIAAGILSSAMPLQVRPAYAATACQCFQEGWDKTINRTGHGHTTPSEPCRLQHYMAYYHGASGAYSGWSLAQAPTRQRSPKWARDRRAEAELNRRKYCG